MRMGEQQDYVQQVLKSAYCLFPRHQLWVKISSRYIMTRVNHYLDDIITMTDDSRNVGLLTTQPPDTAAYPRISYWIRSPWKDQILDILIAIHGTENIKFRKAENAKLIHRFKNTKERFYKTNASIRYNILKPSGNFTYHQV
jgi:hypothetical protein